MTYGELPGAGVGVAGETAMNAPFAWTCAVPATGKQPQLKTAMSAVGAGAYANPPPTVPPVAICITCTWSTGDASGDGEGLGDGLDDGLGDGPGECPELGDGFGPGPGKAVLVPLPPHPATIAAPSAAATHAPKASLVLMILIDSFKSYLPRSVVIARRLLDVWEEIPQPDEEQIERVCSVPVQSVLRLGHEDDVAFLQRHVNIRVSVLQ
jgi:hypothetical protein